MEKKIFKRTIHTAAAGLHVREVADGAQEAPGRTIEGYAILFNTPSVSFGDDNVDIREIIDPQAVTQELLDQSDIKFTMFHNRELILARSNKGEGSLSYGIDDKGVYFNFDAPHTSEGDKALEAVRRGDISGCSFMFAASYSDPMCVKVKRSKVAGQNVALYRVLKIDEIFDFTLALDPAYPDTSVEAREIVMPAGDDNKISEQIAAMRGQANKRIF